MSPGGYYYRTDKSYAKHQADKDRTALVVHKHKTWGDQITDLSDTFHNYIGEGLEPFIPSRSTQRYYINHAAHTAAWLASAFNIYRIHRDRSGYHEGNLRPQDLISGTASLVNLAKQTESISRKYYPSQKGRRYIQTSPTSFRGLRYGTKRKTLRYAQRRRSRKGYAWVHT